jgi:hypothetical protein
LKVYVAIHSYHYDASEVLGLSCTDLEIREFEVVA